MELSLQDDNSKDNSQETVTLTQSPVLENSPVYSPRSHSAKSETTPADSNLNTENLPTLSNLTSFIRVSRSIGSLQELKQRDKSEEQHKLGQGGDAQVHLDTFSITVSHENFTILRVSSSPNHLVAYTNKKLTGHPLIELVSQEELEQRLDTSTSIEPIPCTVCAKFPSDSDQKDLTFENNAFDMELSISDGSLKAQLQPSNRPPVQVVKLPIDDIVASINRIQLCNTILDLLTISTREMRTIIVVDRVMVYELTKGDTHIKVVAEDKQPGCRSFLQQRMPASHMTIHAQMMLKKNNIKIFCDFDNQPVSKHSEQSHSGLDGMRWMTPEHTKFLDSMGIRFTMSVPIIIDEEIWGLFVYHHHKPTPISHSMRVSSELLAHVISSKYENLLKYIRGEKEKQNRANMDYVLHKLIALENWKDALLQGVLHLCEMFGMTGLVIRFGSQYFLSGITPNIPQMELLTFYIAGNDKNVMFKTDNLVSLYEPSKLYKEIASGVLAIALPETVNRHIDMVILIRKEVLQTLNWAEQPDEPEIIEGFSDPWTRVDFSLAQELRQSLIVIKSQNEMRDTKMMQEKEKTRIAIIDKEKSNLYAETSEKSRKEHALFVDTICHEMRNPIHGILGSNSTSRDIVTSLTTSIEAQTLDSATRTSILLQLSQLRQCFDDIDECANHQRIIADDVLQLSTLRQERIVLETNPLNLTSFLNKTIEFSKGRIKDKYLELQLDLFKDDIYVLSDKNRLRQIISNLLDNAIKFTHKGWIKVQVTAKKILHSIPHNSDTVKEESTGEIKVDQSDKAEIKEDSSDIGEDSIYIIQIEDSGFGMTEEETSRIFLPYSQANNTISPKYGGTGLGLVICQELAKRMNGSIVINSTKGVGTKFTFSFQAETISLNRYLLLSTPTPVGFLKTISNNSNTTTKILIAEDNLINQKVLVNMIKKAGYECVVANNGLEAFNLYQELKNPIILMDIQMPVMDGLEATAKIRAYERKEKILPTFIACISGNAAEESKISAFQSGVNAYLVKPINRAELLNMLVLKPNNYRGS